MQPERLVIATRVSRLALWQAEYVQGLLQQQYPNCQVELLKMTTKGDQILDRSLSKIGGKGLFVKELENALLDGRADLAVHSLKDVPVDMPESFSLAAILARAEVRDAFVSNDYDSLASLPANAVVGTSSLRRESQIRAKYPHLQVKPLRGSVDTRLAKLDSKEFAAIILAAAGLQRLNMANRIKSFLSIEDSLPAVGQGALGIEILKSRSDLLALLAPLVCADTTACTNAERAVSKALGGSCQVPIGAYAHLNNQTLHLSAFVALPDGSQLIRAQASGALDQAQLIGEQVAASLVQHGAKDLLASLAIAE